MPEPVSTSPDAPTLRLPPGWDPGLDLIVVVGAQCGTLAARLRAAGQRRLFAFVPAGAEPAGAPGDVPVVRSPAELFAAILALPGAHPAQAVVQEAGIGADLELRRGLASTVQDAVRSRALQAHTVAQAGTTWLEQGIENLPAVAARPAIDVLDGAFARRPAVIVSPGPSLSVNVARLADLKGRALIVAGTHSLHALRSAALVPDLIVCADPGDLARHWEGIDLAEVEAFVVGATCRAEVHAVPARRLFTFASNGALDEWIYAALGEEPGLATGGSVACSQFSLALRLGCDPIVFVGQDLAFTDRFYAAGGLDGDARVTAVGDGSFVLEKDPGARGPGETLEDGTVRFTIPQEILEVPGWRGGTVRTTPTLHSFLRWFEASADSLRDKTRLVNCTEGGAHVRGMAHVSLAEETEGWSETFAIGAILDRATAGHDAPARRRRLAQHMRETARAVGTCAGLARKCKRLARGARDDAVALRKLGRQEAQLARALRAARLISLVAQDEILSAQEDARHAQDVGENLAAAVRLYEVVERAGRFLGEPLRTACLRLSG